jgi:hypothetical protein
MMFSQNFDGFEIVVGKVLIHVTKNSIGTTCRLLIYGKGWWKKEMLPVEIMNQFLLPEHQIPN